MFYPADSLKRGGRFYLCWVADSWPLRFATITHRQLWSQDVRKICDDLLEIMTKESGRPTQRFSLRLSSQLLRGLVRLYQRKVNVFLGELCMIHANVIKNSNKKWNVHDGVKHVDIRPPLPQLDIQEIVQEPQEPELRVGEMIQASGNAVANIEDITLKEAIGQGTDMLLKPNDGFGEENTDQTLQHLQDRTMELMLLGHDISRAVSGGDPARDSIDMSRDKSHLPTHVAQVESMSEQDITMFTKDIPDISVILPPEISIPLPEKDQEMQEAPRLEEPRFVPAEPPKVPETAEIELEELEEPQAKRRRLRKKLIIDKKIKITPQNFRERIENNFVELRCKEAFEDTIIIRVPTELYFRRPCKGGDRIVTNVGFEINRLFVRNLGVLTTQSREERVMEEILARSRRDVTVLERIDEEVDPAALSTRPQPELEPIITDLNITEFNNVTEVLPPVTVEQQMEVDTEALTQKVQTLSQPVKRAMEPDSERSPKRPRAFGSKSLRNELNKKKLSQDLANLEVDKENRDVNIPALSVNIEESVTAENAEKIVSSLLQEAGLADIQNTNLAVIPQGDIRMSQRTVSRGKSARVDNSDGSETPLGSLDRTKVSLGDSDRTTDSIKFIRDHWGTEGTMLKILKLVNGPQPVTVSLLIEKGPIVPGHKKIIAARCFTSILKLKQHGFIHVSKKPDTLEVKDITLGTKLKNYY